MTSRVRPDSFTNSNAYFRTRLLVRRAQRPGRDRVGAVDDPAVGVAPAHRDGGEAERVEPEDLPPGIGPRDRGTGQPPPAGEQVEVDGAVGADDRDRPGPPARWELCAGEEAARGPRRRRRWT